ncbi:MAG: hypothetical protein KF850_15030 [Labilithrix sp.]|nr:hypothetical protein [Labilithrix sp.]
MRVAILAALALSASAALVFACGEDTPATPAEPDGGSGGEAGSPDDASSDEDAGGGNRAPTGCLLKTTDYTIGAKADNVARTDIANSVDWSDVDGALSEDGQFATVTLDEGQESSELRVSGFGFTIPDTAETWGIEVELKRRAPDGGVEDHQIHVEVEGKPTRFKFVKGPWPTSIVGTHAYGQAVDTWGINLFPADVNKESFAAKVSVKRAADAVGPVTAIVDSLKVAVHFCPDPIKP